MILSALTPMEARVPAALALPPTRAVPARCPRVSPGDPRLDGRVGACVELEGWWAVGALVVPEARDGQPGQRVLRPFSYVGETLPSLGWPTWSVLDTVLVDTGWTPAAALPAAPVTTALGDPLFTERRDHVRGWVTRAPGVTERAWDALHPLVRRPGTYPYGDELVGVVLSAPSP